VDCAYVGVIEQRRWLNTLFGWHSGPLLVQPL